MQSPIYESNQVTVGAEGNQDYTGPQAYNVVAAWDDAMSNGSTPKGGVALSWESSGAPDDVKVYCKDVTANGAWVEILQIGYGASYANMTAADHPGKFIVGHDIILGVALIVN